MYDNQKWLRFLIRQIWGVLGPFDLSWPHSIYGSNPDCLMVSFFTTWSQLSDESECEHWRILVDDIYEYYLLDVSEINHWRQCIVIDEIYISVFVGNVKETFKD